MRKNTKDEARSPEFLPTVLSKGAVCSRLYVEIPLIYFYIIYINLSLKIRGVLMIRFFITLFAFYPLIVNAAPPTEEAVFGFVSRQGVKPDLTPDDVKVEHCSGTGSNTNSVSQISILGLKDSKGRPIKKTFICKELKGVKRERENLENLSAFVESFNRPLGAQLWEYPSPLFSFATYVGSMSSRDEEYVVFEEALGQSVLDIAMEWSLKDAGEAGLQKLGYHFRKVGQAVATFHLEHGEFDADNEHFVSIIHRDLHLSNLFYGLWSNRTTFIDYETMATSLVSKGDIAIDLFRLFHFSREEIKPLVKEQAGIKFMKGRTSIFLDEKAVREQSLFIDQHLRRLDSFFSAMEEGYVKTFAAAGYLVNIRNGKVTKLQSLENLLE